jgi:hypothetical protein
MKKFFFVFVLAFCVSTGFGQVYFSVDDIFLNPDNPTTHDSVKIVLSGNLSSTGAYVDTAFFEIIDHEVNITVNCNTYGGFQVIVEYEKIINLGLLPSGDYHINLSGEFFDDQVSDPNQYLFNVSGFSGVHQEKKVNQINIFPNPSSGVFHFDDSDIASIELYNNTGKLLFSIEQKNTIDIRHLPDGVYFIKTYKDNQVFYNKLLKK